MIVSKKLNSDFYFKMLDEIGRLGNFIFSGIPGKQYRSTFQKYSNILLPIWRCLIHVQMLHKDSTVMFISDL